MADYFFELLTEEIPAWMHETAVRTLQDRLTKIAGDLGATDPANSVVITTTPRRIAFLISGLRLREEDRHHAGHPSAVHAPSQTDVVLRGDRSVRFSRERATAA